MRTRRRAWLRDWIRSALGLAIIVNLVLLVAGHTISPWAGVGLPAVAAVAIATGSALRRRPEPLVDSGSGEGRQPAPLESYVRLRQRVRWATDQPLRMGPALHTTLIALTADRLRRHHGVDLGGDPAVVRPLVGDALWGVVTAAEPPVGLSAADLDALTRRLETL